jgi:hypothetical protein
MGGAVEKVFEFFELMFKIKLFKHHLIAQYSRLVPPLLLVTRRTLLLLDWWLRHKNPLMASQRRGV